MRNEKGQYVVLTDVLPPNPSGLCSLLQREVQDAS
jgi:hypothetical protein